MTAVHRARNEKSPRSGIRERIRVIGAQVPMTLFSVTRVPNRALLMQLPNGWKGVLRFANLTSDFKLARISPAKRDLSRLAYSPAKRQCRIRVRQKTLCYTSASRSFKVFPDSSFQATLPFAEPNTQKPAAAEGLLNGISFVRTKSAPM